MGALDLSAAWFSAAISCGGKNKDGKFIISGSIRLFQPFERIELAQPSNPMCVTCFTSVAFGILEGRMGSSNFGPTNFLHHPRSPLLPRSCLLRGFLHNKNRKPQKKVKSVGVKGLHTWMKCVCECVSCREADLWESSQCLALIFFAAFQLLYLIQRCNP